MELARRLKEGVDFLLCYGFTGAAQAAHRTPANVILDSTLGGKHAPCYIALENGFYERNCSACCFIVELIRLI